jgi:uncharacterized protein YybS (DUF2232 family)
VQRHAVDYGQALLADSPFSDLWMAVDGVELVYYCMHTLKGVSMTTAPLVVLLIVIVVAVSAARRRHASHRKDGRP